MEPLLLATFIAYFVVVIGIGAYFYNRSAKMKEYFIADRQLNPYVVALSAQASDMSGWLLMGLPGSILAAGVGEIWVGIGLAIGTYLAWLIIAKRLRIYSEKANNSITISEFFSNRFKDDKGTIRVLCGIVLLIFFTFYVASAFVSGGKILQAIFPDSGYLTMMLACAAIIIVYTFLGGFKAVCWTDFFQGLLMFVAVVIVPFALMGELGGFDEMISAVESIAATDSDFNIDFITCGWIAIISGLAWGLGYFGMPHIHVRYMAIKNANDIRISRRVATTWVVIALACACLIGLFGRAWVDTNNLVLENPENILILIVNEMWATSIPIFAGLIFAGIMAAVMSTADSQLLVASSSVSNDIYKHFKGDSISDEKLVWISRGIVIVVAIVAALIALDPASSIMNLVSFAWAGFGAAFGPLMILALFWKRTNKYGAIAGIITGFLTTILWNTFLGSCIIAKIIGIESLVIDTPLTGLYELVPGFLFAFIAIIIVSLLTAKPGEGMTKIFDEVDNECKATAKHFGKGFAVKTGIVAALVFFIGIAVTVCNYDGCICHTDIGTLLVSDPAMFAAFIAVFIGGFFVALFGYGLSRSNDSMMQLGGYLVIFAGIAMMFAGFVPNNYDAHFIARNCALIIGAIALVVIIARQLMEQKMIVVGLCGVIGAAFFALWMTGSLELSVAVAFALMGCLAVQALKQIGEDY